MQIKVRFAFVNVTYSVYKPYELKNKNYIQCLCIKSAHINVICGTQEISHNEPLKMVQAVEITSYKYLTKLNKKTG